MSKKIHWVRKSYWSHVKYDYGKKKCIRVKEAIYDAYAVCGQFAILNSTIFRNKVTCKACRKIMEKKHE